MLGRVGGGGGGGEVEVEGYTPNIGMPHRKSTGCAGSWQRDGLLKYSLDGLFKQIYFQTIIWAYVCNSTQLK